MARVTRRVRVVAKSAGDFTNTVQAVRTALASALAERGMPVIDPDFKPARRITMRLKQVGMPEWFAHLTEMFSHRAEEQANYTVEVELRSQIDYVQPAVGEFRWVERILDGTFKREGTERYKELVPVVRMHLQYRVYDERGELVGESVTRESPPYLLGTAWPGLVDAVQVATMVIPNLILEAERNEGTVRAAA